MSNYAIHFEKEVKHRKNGKNKKSKKICQVTTQPHNYILSVEVNEYGWDVVKNSLGEWIKIGRAHYIYHTDRCKDCKAKRIRRIEGEQNNIRFK